MKFNIKVMLKFLLVFCLLCPLLFGGCAFNNGEIYLIPDHFRGRVKVEFNHPDGVKQEFERNCYVFRIPENGVLSTAHVNDRCENPIEFREFYLVDAKGKRTRLEVRDLKTPPDNINILYIFDFKTEMNTKKYPPLNFMVDCSRHFIIDSYKNARQILKKESKPQK